MKNVRLKLIFSLLCIVWFVIELIFTHSLVVQAASTENFCADDMVLIPGGTFTIGSDRSDFREERSAKNITIDSFCIDKYEVTNSQFAEFVKATNYKTIAERPLSKQQFPDLPDYQRLPGSLVFKPPEEGVKQVAYLSWWYWTPGANWQHPYGLNSNIEGKGNYPVVHIAYEDAEAYAQWKAKHLPTEAQWEYAARGGLDNKTFSWGNQYFAKKANTWQGIFPVFNTKKDGYLDIAPVGSFPPNGYDLYDTIGNVWEWTSDWYTPGHSGKAYSKNPTGPNQEESFDPKKPEDEKIRVLKGGSYLCAKNYCSRYRPAARESQTSDTGTSHIGFRLVKNLELAI